jgi:coenzyme F420-0:L-glutamate ligase / coenzyme F420-1:gamma-L-glutamate ligase
MTEALQVMPVRGLSEIAIGDRLGELIVRALEEGRRELGEGDVVVIAQKAVSKAEGRVRDLREVDPGEEAQGLAKRLHKDPRLIELVLRESREVIRAERDVLIVETTGGWICANAGIDASNVPGRETVTLLPEDADESARRIRHEIAAAAGMRPAVVVSDSFGRPWRLGQTDVAIGCAGLAPLDDWRGRSDREGRELAATVVAVADEAAAAANLARRKDAGLPACLVRGLGGFVAAGDGAGARALQRPRDEDLFR